ncbi:MAG: hypothetical protein ACT4QF_22510 [Sporichthyaceae bacterium]
MFSNTRKTYVPKHPPLSPFNKPEPVAPPPAVYHENDRVTHDRYGLGTVIRVVESFEVTVDFGAQTVRLALPSSKLCHL